MDVFATSHDAIVVAADINNVVAVSGTTGNYKLNSISPSAPGVVSATPAAAANANMTISGLIAGTSYDLGFVNVVNICGADQVSAETVVSNVCTSKKAASSFLFLQFFLFLALVKFRAILVFFFKTLNKI